MNNSLTDTHAHLDLPELEDHVEQVLKNAAERGVKHVLCVGTSIDSTHSCINLAGQFSPLRATAGIHPNYCADAGESAFDELDRLAGNPACSAIGETGIDCHHDFSDLDMQEVFFRYHIELAMELHKPLIIHARKADERILKILDEYPQPVRGVRHCFDSSAQIAKEYTNRGLHIAFGGLITKNGFKKLKKAAATVPEQKLLLETDSPFITPKRAKKGQNEPANLAYIAEAMAEIRNITVEKVANITTNNALELGLF